MSEKQLTNSIIEYLNYSGLCYVWKVNAGMIRTETKGKSRMIRLAKAGQSDIQGYMKGTGQFIALEVKLPSTRKQVTELQQQFIDEVALAGGIGAVVVSEDEALDVVKWNRRK